MPKQTAPTEAPEGTTEEATQPALLRDAPEAPATSSNWEALQGYPAAGYDAFDSQARPAALPDDFEINVDTSNVDVIARLPVGTFHGRCTGIRPGKASAKGDPCWIWTLQATEGPEAGGSMDHYTYTGPNTVWKFAEVKRALGFDDRESITPAAVRNRACTFTVVESEYQGKKRVQVDLVAVPAKAPLGAIIEYGDENPPF